MTAAVLHTDMDPLRQHPSAEVHFIGPGVRPPPGDLILLPGSKSVRSDLAWLREQGWEDVIRRHLRYGGRLIGVCGGFQMLGRQIHDPAGLEGASGSAAGFGLLDVETTLAPDNQLRNVRGRLTFAAAPVAGYEIHAGSTRGAALQDPALRLEHGPDGAIGPDRQILGTYLHGLFESPPACEALLAWAGLTGVQAPDYHALREAAIERLADTVEEHLNTRALLALLTDRQQ